MTNTPFDELGPSTTSSSSSRPARATSPARWRQSSLALVEAGTIRVIDVLILTKNEDGSVDAMELSDIEELGELQAIEAELAELLAEEDVAHLAAAMDPGQHRRRPDLGEPLGGRRSRRQRAVRAAS